MRSIPACCLLCLLPALVLSTRKGYEDLEKKLKDIFMERNKFLHLASKTSRALEGIKENLKTLKIHEPFAKSHVQTFLDLEEKQREEMQTLQETFRKQLNEATEKAEKQQATVNFLKTEIERKNKMIRDLQNENKSLKNKLMSGNKFCGLRAEESKRIQAQLKELRYGKKDLFSKAQKLTDLEQKLTVAKDDMEKASLDQESQLKALKETVQLCLSSVLHSQPSTINVIPSKLTASSSSLAINTLMEPSQNTSTESPMNSSGTESHPSGLRMNKYQHDENSILHSKIQDRTRIKPEYKHSTEEHRRNAGNLHLSREQSLQDKA